MYGPAVPRNFGKGTRTVDTVGEEGVLGHPLKDAPPRKKNRKGIYSEEMLASPTNKKRKGSGNREGQQKGSHNKQLI